MTGEWVPHQITTDMPSYTGAAQETNRAYWGHYELRQEGGTLRLYDLALDAAPVTRTLIDTKTYTMGSGYTNAYCLESLGDGRFFILYTDGNGPLSAARIVNTAGGVLSIGPEQAFAPAPANVTGYRVLAVSPTAAVATANAGDIGAYNTYWWQYTIFGTTVTRGTVVVDTSTSSNYWARTPIIAMPDGKVVSDSILFPANSQRLSVHATAGTKLSDLTLGVYDEVRVSANTGTQNGHGGVDAAGHAVVATWYKLDGQTRASMTVRTYAVSSSLIEVAHLDVVPEFTDPDRVWMDLYHFANLGDTGSRFVIVGIYDWWASDGETDFVRIIDTATMTSTDIPAPPTQGGGISNAPRLSMAINENAFLLTYGASLDVYEEWIYVWSDVGLPVDVLMQGELLTQTGGG